MCLKTYSATPTIAEKDIVVYKVLLWDSYGERYLSPFQGHEYNLGVEEVVDDMYQGYTKSEYYFNYTIHIDEGLHSFTTKREAKRGAKFFMFGYSDDLKERDVEVVILKSIIPKGAKYYKGTWGSGGTSIESYASDKLTVTHERVARYKTKWYNLLLNKLRCAFGV